MIPAQASHTAYRVALRRATHQLLDAPPVFVDPIAIEILGPRPRPRYARTPRSTTAALAGLIWAGAETGT